MSKSHKKSGGKKDIPTILHRKVAKVLVEKGGKVTMGGALRAAGASPSIIKNPDRVFKSVGFAKELEKVGLTDKFIAKKYVSLMSATNIDKEIFEGFKVKGKWTYPSDDLIRETIEGTEEAPTGCKVMFVKIDTTYKRKMVTFRRPDNGVQKGMIELAGKVKSHFAPDKLDIVHHELDEEERKLLAGLLNR